MDIDKKKREFATCKEGFIPDIGGLVNYGNTSFNDITKMMLKDMDSRMKKIETFPSVEYNDWMYIKEGNKIVLFPRGRNIENITEYMIKLKKHNILTITKEDDEYLSLSLNTKDFFTLTGEYEMGSLSTLLSIAEELGEIIHKTGRTSSLCIFLMGLDNQFHINN